MSTGSVATFSPAGGIASTVLLAATTTSTIVKLAVTNADSVLVYNSSTVLAFVQLGLFSNSPVALLVGSVPVPPGASILLGASTNVDCAAVIMSSTTGTLYFTSGNGTQR